MSVLIRAILPALLATLSSCSLGPYNVIFNDNVLFSPNEALRGAVLRDAALQGCLNQTMASTGTEEPAGVTLLACPGAGVETLVGIDALTSLQQLELSDNAISNIAPLGALRNLRVLSLRNNNVGNIGTLEGLATLRFISLEGNERIPCRQLDSLGDKLGSSLSRPQGCLR